MTKRVLLSFLLLITLIFSISCGTTDYESDYTESTNDYDYDYGDDFDDDIVDTKTEFYVAVQYGHESDGGSDGYWYLTDDSSIDVGDIISIPVEKGGTTYETCGVVVDTASLESEPWPYSDTKHVNSQVCKHGL